MHKLRRIEFADNRTNEEAEWDIDLLKVEFKDLQDQGWRFIADRF
jgi:uncharacterized lipoprotein YehR (DUF1307 family)